MNYSKTGMDIEDIKGALRKTYGPLTAISEKLGFNKNAVSSAIRVSGYSVHLERVIAELLGKTPYDVWGMERFNKDGSAVKRAPVVRSFKDIPTKFCRKSGIRS